MAPSAVGRNKKTSFLEIHGIVLTSLNIAVHNKTAIQFVRIIEAKNNASGDNDFLSRLSSRRFFFFTPLSVILSCRAISAVFIPSRKIITHSWRISSGSLSTAAMSSSMVSCRMSSTEKSSSKSALSCRKKAEQACPGVSSKALEYIGLLYTQEENLRQRKASYEEVAKERKERGLPIMDAMEAWMKVASKTTTPSDLLGKALDYAYKLWPRMRNYALDGRAAQPCRCLRVPYPVYSLPHRHQSRRQGHQGMQRCQGVREDVVIKGAKACF